MKKFCISDGARKTFTSTLVVGHEGKKEYKLISKILYSYRFLVVKMWFFPSPWWAILGLFELIAA